MYAGYCLGNETELWNNQRVLDYLVGDPNTFVQPMRNRAQFINRSASCAGLNDVVCNPPGATGRYQSPEIDDAPWYDPQVPESKDFAGLFVEEIVGFDSVVDRSVTEGAIYGGALGPLRLGSRKLTVTGYLFAKTCAGAEYGLGWLNEALIGSSGCIDCALGEFYLLASCPAESPADPLDYTRLMLRTGLVDGPKVVDRFGTCCNACGYTTLKVQFTIASEVPYVFSDLRYALFEEPFSGGVVEEYEFDAFCNDCPPVVDNTFQPDCGPAFIPRPASFSVIDECYCDPWCVNLLCTTVEVLSDWNTATTVVQIATGSGDMRNLKIRAYENAAAAVGVDCPCVDIHHDEYWKCRQPCATVEVGRLPSGSVLTIDSRTRVASLKLPGGQTQSALRYLTSPGAGGFDWFDLPQCSTYCFVVTAECGVAGDATLTIASSGKYLASGG